MKNKIRDIVTISNQEGKEEDYLVEALFQVNGDSYALLKHENGQLHLAQIDEENGEQYLTKI